MNLPFFHAEKIYFYSEKKITIGKLLSLLSGFYVRRILRDAVLRGYFQVDFATSKGRFGANGAVARIFNIWISPIFVVYLYYKRRAASNEVALLVYLPKKTDLCHEIPFEEGKMTFEEGKTTSKLVFTTSMPQKFCAIASDICQDFGAKIPDFAAESNFLRIEPAKFFYNTPHF